MGRLLASEVLKYSSVDGGYSQVRTTSWTSSTTAATAAAAPMVSLTFGGYMPLTRPSSSSASSSSSGSNGLNIVAAILVTASSMMVLLALRLWLCRCSSASPSDPLQPASDVSPAADDAYVDPVKKSSGIGKDVISKFALVDFKSLSASEYDKTCTVCLSDFTSKDAQIRLLPGCNHSFHPACIEMWLFSHASCPICRKSLLPVTPPPQVNEETRVVAS